MEAKEFYFTVRYSGGLLVEMVEATFWDAAALHDWDRIPGDDGVVRINLWERFDVALRQNVAQLGLVPDRRGYAGAAGTFKAEGHYEASELRRCLLDMGFRVIPTWSKVHDSGFSCEGGSHVWKALLLWPKLRLDRCQACGLIKVTSVRDGTHQQFYNDTGQSVRDLVAYTTGFLAQQVQDVLDLELAGMAKELPPKTIWDHLGEGD